MVRHRQWCINLLEKDEKNIKKKNYTSSSFHKSAFKFVHQYKDQKFNSSDGKKYDKKLLKMVQVTVPFFFYFDEN